MFRTDEHLAAASARVRAELATWAPAVHSQHHADLVDTLNLARRNALQHQLWTFETVGGHPDSARDEL